MSDWDAPPKFAPDGTPPPVRSPMHVLPSVYLGRSGPKFSRSAVKMLTSGDHENHPDFGEAFAWLAENYNSAAYLGADFERQISSARRVATGGMITTFIPGGFAFGLGMQAAVFGKLYLDSRREILRIDGRSFWERNDPMSYVAPGLTSTISRSCVAGISTTRSREFSSTIGGSTKGSSRTRNLSAEFGAKWVRSATRSEQVEVKWTNQVHNPSLDKTRVVAIWTPMISMSIARLTIAGDILKWEKLDEFEYFTDADTGMATTIADVVL